MNELGGFDHAAARGRRRTSREAKRSQDQFGYRAALQIVHGILNPRSYVEIGCQHGASLAIARCPAIAVDPEFEITQQLSAPTRIFRQTSEQFFKTYNLRSLVSGPFDLAFIDGLHHAEAALLDFMNLEINSGPNSVIVIDDVLPADMAWTTRERHTRQWTGDVYKLPLLLRTLRPDLSVELFDIADKGMAIVSRLDRNSKVLPRMFDELRRAIVDGEYRLDSVDAIRTALAPRPVSQLVGHLLDIVAARISGLTDASGRDRS